MSGKEGIFPRIYANEEQMEANLDPKGFSGRADICLAWCVCQIRRGLAGETFRVWWRERIGRFHGVIPGY